MPYNPIRVAPSSNLTALQSPPNDGTVNLLGMQDNIPVVFSEHRAAQLGRYFTASNPTIGTFPQAGAAGAGTTSFQNTTAMFTINNTDAAGGRSIFLRAIKLSLGGTAPTATVSLESAFVIDTVSRQPSSGNVAITPTNMSTASGVTSIAAVQAFTGNANLTVPAPGTAAKTVSRVRIPTNLGVVGDNYFYSFGGGVDPTSQGATSGGTRTSASAPGTFIGNGEPIIIEPGQWLVAHIWWLTAATTAPSFEYSLSWMEL